MATFRGSSCATVLFGCQRLAGPLDQNSRASFPQEQDRERARELATRPPLTRLVHRESNVLALYLAAIYVAHLEVAAGSGYTNNRHNIVNGRDGAKAWNVLSGLWMPGSHAARRARVRRALAELSAARLVSIKPVDAHYRFEDWLLLSEEGTESTYRRPSEREGAVVLPAAFFYNGWHLVLTPVSYSRTLS